MGKFLVFNEDWDEKDPGGKNWHLETAKVPSAWNLLEKESDRVNNVPVGIMEAGIYRNHEEYSDYSGIGSEFTYPGTWHGSNRGSGRDRGQ